MCPTTALLMRACAASCRCRQEALCSVFHVGSCRSVSRVDIARNAYLLAIFTRASLTGTTQSGDGRRQRWRGLASVSSATTFFRTRPCACCRCKRDCASAVLSSLTRMLQCMRRQFVEIMRSAGFLPSSDDAGRSSSDTGMLGGSAANENSGHEDVVKAVVAAGLYPNVVCVDKSRGRPTSRPPRLAVRGIGRVELHPKSALSGSRAFPQPYLVYHTLVRSSACFVHDATCVPIMALMLFGGKLTVTDLGEGRQAVAMTLDDWLTLHVAAESAACVTALTERMQHCLKAKFTTPTLDVYVLCNPPPPLSDRYFCMPSALSHTADTVTRVLLPSQGRRCNCCAAVSRLRALQ